MAEPRPVKSKVVGSSPTLSALLLCVEALSEIGIAPVLKTGRR